MAHDRGLAASPGVGYTLSMGSDDRFPIPPTGYETTGRPRCCDAGALSFGRQSDRKTDVASPRL